MNPQNIYSVAFYDEPRYLRDGVRRKRLSLDNLDEVCKSCGTTREHFIFYLTRLTGTDDSFPFNPNNILLTDLLSPPLRLQPLRVFFDQKMKKILKVKERARATFVDPNLSLVTLKKRQNSSDKSQNDSLDEIEWSESTGLTQKLNTPNKRILKRINKESKNTDTSDTDDDDDSNCIINSDTEQTTNKQSDCTSECQSSKLQSTTSQLGLSQLSSSSQTSSEESSDSLYIPSDDDNGFMTGSNKKQNKKENKTHILHKMTVINAPIGLGKTTFMRSIASMNRTGIGEIGRGSAFGLGANHLTKPLVGDIITERLSSFLDAQIINKIKTAHGGMYRNSLPLDDKSLFIESLSNARNFGEGIKSSPFSGSLSGSSSPLLSGNGDKKQSSSLRKRRSPDASSSICFSNASLTNYLVEECPDDAKKQLKKNLADYFGNECEVEKNKKLVSKRGKRRRGNNSNHDTESITDSDSDYNVPKSERKSSKTARKSTIVTRSMAHKMEINPTLKNWLQSDSGNAIELKKNEELLKNSKRKTISQKPNELEKKREEIDKTIERYNSRKTRFKTAIDDLVEYNEKRATKSLKPTETGCCSSSVSDVLSEDNNVSHNAKTKNTNDIPSNNKDAEDVSSQTPILVSNPKRAPIFHEKAIITIDNNSPLSYKDDVTLRWNPTIPIFILDSGVYSECDYKSKELGFEYNPYSNSTTKILNTRTFFDDSSLYEIKDIEKIIQNILNKNTSNNYDKNDCDIEEITDEKDADKDDITNNNQNNKNKSILTYFMKKEECKKTLSDYEALKSACPTNVDKQWKRQRKIKAVLKKIKDEITRYKLPVNYWSETCPSLSYKEELLFNPKVYKTKSSNRYYRQNYDFYPFLRNCDCYSINEDNIKEITFDVKASINAILMAFGFSDKNEIEFIERMYEVFYNSLRRLSNDNNQFYLCCDIRKTLNSLHYALINNDKRDLKEIMYTIGCSNPYDKREISCLNTMKSSDTINAEVALMYSYVDVSKFKTKEGTNSEEVDKKDESTEMNNYLNWIDSLSNLDYCNSFECPRDFCHTSFWETKKAFESYDSLDEGVHSEIVNMDYFELVIKHSLTNNMLCEKALKSFSYFNPVMNNLHSGVLSKDSFRGTSMGSLELYLESVKGILH